MLSRYLSSVFAVSILASGCGKAPTEETAPPPPKPPLSTTGQPYLTGEQVANIYEKHTFCYPHSATSCKMTEELIERSPTQIRINNYHVAKKAAPKIKSLEDLAYQAFTNKTSLNPEGSIDIDVQTHTIAAWGLCRTKAQRIEDTGKYHGYYVVDINKLSGETVPYSQGLQDDLRAIQFKFAMESLGNVRCSHYYVEPVTDIIKEETSIDGIVQPSTPSTIMFFPRGNYLRLSPR